MARDGERGRGDWKARLGSRNSGPYAEGVGDTGPVDIAAVRRDDALIDAIASDGPVRTDSAEEYQLATLLADWRAELISEPMPGEPSLDEIVAAVNQEIGARQVRIGAQTSGRLRLLRPIAGTAAALALVFGGMTAFSYNAEPGDPLWRVKEVVFSEQAQTTVVQRADNDLDAAQALLNSGNHELAKAKLDGARQNVTQVNDTEKQNDLAARWELILTELRKVAPDVANSITATPSRPADPKPTTDTSGTKPSTGIPQQTVLQSPETSGTKPPTGEETTAPGQPPTTAPPTTQITVMPTTPPPTQNQPPQTTQVAPTTVPTVVVPTVDTGQPTQPATRPTVPGNDSGPVVVPTGSGGTGGTGVPGGTGGVPGGSGPT
ncbi:anti-sigma-D factor RsdA [Nocardia sp. GCM10030253]|uniref:anti-sigma-D factor RsdA n=1 Tax=Nocardia sp. GCM10030253 TaxID=3273404 RepID=UPI003639FC16